MLSLQVTAFDLITISNIFINDSSSSGSEADPKGSDCYDQFSSMQECFSRYPTVYNRSGNDGDDDGDDASPFAAVEGNQNPVETADQSEEGSVSTSASSSKSNSASKPDDDSKKQ